ncbi:mitochondrial carrier domain-containing protein [Protomyces lactucae-debilis]|uniref:Mitochondrial carrier domain-containing protein n=1 Tax=Protomyces lactucae-debilis TaxID=2754530 RepID=A0A1Y2FK25_PROLT|nr:mitochondrial carrier domain-containing protein [Protomyces lactucae-debilis]ORY84322.1 mitochondrial carrier domain-containing protein [Protomyces lactucae-debilis]
MPWLDADFIAGFFSGLAGLIVGSPLDIIKTLRQSGQLDEDSTGHGRLSVSEPRTWFTGLLAPLFALGLQNALLFWSYESIMMLFAQYKPSLLLSLFAGCCSGICVFFVSCPTEVIKVQAQTSALSSRVVILRLLRRQCKHPFKKSPFLRGGLVTILRDSIGYGFYFVSYDALGLLLRRYTAGHEALVTLLAGGLAGCISWFSIYPLDTIKTRLQADSAQHAPLMDATTPLTTLRNKQGLLACGLSIMQERARAQPGSFKFMAGITGLYAGLAPAMLRAFIVNGVIFYTERFIKDVLVQ